MPRTPPISQEEISLIKRMLLRGMRNNEIQFYFNTPARPVNNGRISEVRSGFRGGDVPAATDEDLDIFLNRHSQTPTIDAGVKLAPPTQSPAGATFQTSDSGLIDLSPIGANDIGDSDVSIIYDELKSKTGILGSLGHNVLGPTYEHISDFEKAVRRPLSEVYVIIWSKGNWLRKFVDSYKNVHPEDNPLGRIDPSCEGLLQDLIQTFNILVTLSPRLSQLEQASFGPKDIETVRQALADVTSASDAMAEIASETARSTVEAVLDDVEPSEGIFHNLALKTASATVYNFFISSLKSAFRIAAGSLRRSFESSLRVGLAALQTLISSYALSVATANIPPVISFIKEHAPAIGNFIEAVGSNPVAIEMLKAIAKAFAG